MIREPCLQSLHRRLHSRVEMGWPDYNNHRFFHDPLTTGVWGNVNFRLGRLFVCPRDAAARLDKITTQPSGSNSNLISLGHSQPTLLALLSCHLIHSPLRFLSCLENFATKDSSSKKKSGDLADLSLLFYSIIIRTVWSVISIILLLGLHLSQVVKVIFQAIKLTILGQYVLRLERGSHRIPHCKFTVWCFLSASAHRITLSSCLSTLHKIVLQIRISKLFSHFESVS